MAILAENWDEGIRGNFSFQGSKLEEAKDELRHPEYLERYIRGNLTPSPKAGRDMFNCPFCGSGTHEHKTGAFHAMPPKWGERARWKCEACGKSGDLFDLIGRLEGMEGKENFARQVNRAAEIFGLDIEPRREKSAANTEPALFSFKANKANEPSPAEEPPAAETAEPLRTFEDFYREAHKHIGDTDYWQRRGLTRETVERFNLGYCAAWRHPKAAANAPTSARLIIPVTPYSYLARAVDDDTPKEATKLKARCGEHENLSYWTFNAQALTTARRPIYIVEGEIDAMSVIQAGGEAVAIGSIANVATFLQQIDRTRPTQPLIIALDNDAAGQAHVEKLADGLTARGIFFSRQPAEIWDGYKDANEALTESPATLKAAIADAPRLIAEEEARRAEAERLAKIPPTIREGAAALDSLQPITIKRITELAKQRGKGFDFHWTFYNGNGEEHPITAQGLTIIAARTGGGKTFSLANLAARALIVDPAAQVLFLSLEEAEESVFYRVLTAYVAQRITERGEDMYHAPTVKDTSDALEAGGDGWKGGYGYNARKWDLMADGIRDITPRVLVADLFNTPDLRNVDFTFGLIWEFFSRYKEKAVIFLDYIQLLQPNGTHTNDYREIKSIMSRLKELVAARVNLIAGAQLNRDAATRYANPRDEFLQTIPEQIREGADIEQAAELILFCKSSHEVVVDGGGIMGHAIGERYYMNYRTLKNRRGANDLAMSFPCDFSRALDFTQQLKCDLLSSEASAENTTEAKKTKRFKDKKKGTKQEQSETVLDWSEVIAKLGTDTSDYPEPEDPYD